MVEGAVRTARHKARLANLKKIIKAQFNNNTSAAARAIDVSHTYMWQLVRGHRAIGEESARKIEEKLKLGAGFLSTVTSKRTEVLTAVVGEGVTVSYPMVPKLVLEDLSARPKSHQPFPDARQDGAKMFCAEVTSEEMAELKPGDLIFADRADVELQSSKLYVVAPRGVRSRAARIMKATKVASGGCVFGTTNPDAPRQALDCTQVKIIARVVLIVRNL